MVLNKRNNKQNEFIDFCRAYYMEVKINFPENNNHISNLAHIKALMIKKTIEDLNISSEEKEKLRKEVLEHLRKT